MDRTHTKGRIDIVHADSEKKEKIRALIDAVRELAKDTQFEDMDRRTTYLKHRIESLKTLADEAEDALSSLNIPVLNVGGCDG